MTISARLAVGAGLCACAADAQASRQARAALLGLKGPAAAAGRQSGEAFRLVVAMCVVRGTSMAGRLHAKQNGRTAGVRWFLRGCFPARGLPQSGSKGLSQSQPCQTATPLANALFQARVDCRCKKAKPSSGRALRASAGAQWVLTGSAQSNTGDSTPSTLCSLGLVVVYCRNTFLSGKMMGMAPKAARAHSWKPHKMSFFLPG